MSTLCLPELLALYPAFQQRYPDHTLVADLLAYQDGAYAIRAVVYSGSTMVSTGMAADASIAVAEDNAKLRALMALGLGRTMPPQALQEPDLDFNPLPMVEMSATVESAPSPAAPPPAKPTPPAPKRPEPAPPQSDHSVPPIPGGSTANSSTASASMAGSSMASPPTTSPPTTSSPTTSSPVAHVNLLDQLAKTDVEMQRLGWDVDQGRQALLQRYGKRSRRELTDDEVLDFLHYLEHQP